MKAHSTVALSGLIWPGDKRDENKRSECFFTRCPQAEHYKHVEEVLLEGLVGCPYGLLTDRHLLVVTLKLTSFDSNRNVTSFNSSRISPHQNPTSVDTTKSTTYLTVLEIQLI